MFEVVNSKVYCQASNISCTLLGNKIVDHSDIAGASPGSVLLQLHLHSQLNTWFQWIGQRQLQDRTGNIEVFGFGVTYIRGLTVVFIHNLVTDILTSSGGIILRS